MFSSKIYNCVYFVLVLAASYSKGVSAQNFSVLGNTFNCKRNLICLGAAHTDQSESSLNNTAFDGRLSLISETTPKENAAVAYYKERVRMLDNSNRKSASFNTSFIIDQEMEYYQGSTGRLTGGGLTFVISADSSFIGAPDAFFGIFDSSGTQSFKSIVVEFDSYLNAGPPYYDISENHVSFAFHNVTWVAARNASDVNVLLWYNTTIYAWLEYSADTQRLELRISNNNSRPIRPLLAYTVDLFNVVDEYMWVGFSSGSGGTYNHYYIGDWQYESYGIYVPPPPKARSKVGLIVGVSVGGLVLVAVAGVLICFIVSRLPSVRRWRQGNPEHSQEDPMLELCGMPERISYKHLSVATGAFGDNSKLGQGGFGSVYRGLLPTSGTPVAVKKISGDSNQGQKEFMAEVSIISQLRHRNLIQLLGWCRDRGKYLLVYELMPNGSLDKALFLPDGIQTAALSWNQRFNIVCGTAAALDYLHRGWKQQVIHRDVKASNIMLDENWNAKLGDFGLARLVDHLRTAPTTVVAGTYGYIAPEAAAGRFTEKTDVFAFGAVALEIACGRKAFHVHGAPNEIVLVDWVWERLSEGDLLSVVDKRLGDYDRYWMEVVLLTGLLCSHPDPSARPSMARVVQVFAGEAEVASVPAMKPAAVFKSESKKVVSIEDLHRSNSNLRNTPLPTMLSGSLTLTIDLAR